MSLIALDARSTQPDLDLSAVLHAAAAGDERAWRTLIDLYARRVYALARSRLGGGRGVGGGGEGDDAAEEVTQSVFATIAAKLTQGGYTEQGRFESWLFRVAMNRVRDEARRRKRHAEPTDPETLQGIAEGGNKRVRGAGDQATGEESVRELAALRTALGLLSETDREVIELRHHAGMSFKQMAEMLSEPLGTLLARHHRALRKLKELMTNAGAGGAPEGRTP